MRGEEADTAAFDRKLAAATGSAHQLAAGDPLTGDDPLAALKDKMAADKAAKAKTLAAPDDKKP